MVSIAGSMRKASVSACDLGVTLDQYLMMSTHVSNLCKSASLPSSVSVIFASIWINREQKTDSHLCVLSIGLLQQSIVWLPDKEI